MLVSLAQGGDEPPAPNGKDRRVEANGKPIFNSLAWDGGRCEVCEANPQAVYFDCYRPGGAHWRNVFVCASCAPEKERELQQLGLKVVVVGGNVESDVPPVQLDIYTLLDEAA